MCTLRVEAAAVRLSSREVGCASESSGYPTRLPGIPAAYPAIALVYSKARAPFTLSIMAGQRRLDPRGEPRLRPRCLDQAPRLRGRGRTRSRRARLDPIQAVCGRRPPDPPRSQAIPPPGGHLALGRSVHPLLAAPGRSARPHDLAGAPSPADSPPKGAAAALASTGTGWRPPRRHRGPENPEPHEDKPTQARPLLKSQWPLKNRG